MRVASLFGPGPGGKPAGPVRFSHTNHIHDTRGKVGTHFDDGAPSCPHRRGRLAPLQHIFQGKQIFPVQIWIAILFHILRRSGPLGIYVYHHKAVVAIGPCYALYAFQCIVQMIRLCGRGVDPDGDQRFFSAGAQNISIFCIKVGNIQSSLPVISVIGALIHGGGKRKHVRLICSRFWNMHDVSFPLLGL